MQQLKWLYPGMGIKRWISLCVVGLLLVGSGFLMAVLGLTQSPVHRGWLAAGAAVLCAGIYIVITGVYRMMKSVLSVVLPTQYENQLVELMYRQRQLERGPKVVAIGGGTGLSTLLAGLKKHTSNITALVTVADDGGSSGRLREAFDMPPPGDIRNCLVALADAEPLMRELFQYRFEDGSELRGHTFGNLFITAMMRVMGDFEAAVRESSRILNVRGRVLPSSVRPVLLVAELADGRRLSGETNISKAGAPIKRLTLDAPTACEAPAEVIKSLTSADAIILGPGSLYTSVLPNLLVPGIRETIQQSHVPVIYACNVMTQYSETEGYTAADHLDAIIAHTQPGFVQYCIVNTAAVPASLLTRYRQERAHPVRVDHERLRSQGCDVIEGPVISTTNYVRHDADHLAKLILSLVTTKIKLKR